MYKCNGCGKEYANSQGLGSHQRFGCGSPSAVVQQADDIIRGLSRSGPGLAQVSHLKTGTKSRPQVTAQTSHLDRTADLEYNLPSDQKSLAELKQELAEAKVRDELGKQMHHVRGRQWRRMGVVCVLVGIAAYFIGGGKLKLPFIGDCDS